MEPVNESGLSGGKPLMFGFAVRRSGDSVIPGRYSENRQMWLVEVDGSDLPIVCAIKEIPECVTKTAAQVESDDETRPRPRNTVATPSQAIANRFSDAVLELATKTEAGRERDD